MQLLMRFTLIAGEQERMSNVGWLKMSFNFGAEISTFYSSIPLLLLVSVLAFIAPCLIP